MDQKTAINILIKMISSDKLSQEEKDAVDTAIKILTWTSLSEGRIKAIKEKKAKNNINK